MTFVIVAAALVAVAFAAGVYFAPKLRADIVKVDDYILARYRAYEAKAKAVKAAAEGPGPVVPPPPPPAT